MTGRDRRDFPGFFAAGFGGFDFKGAMPASEVTSLATRYVCTGPLRYAGTALVQADIDRLTAAAGAHDVTAFLPAITPGTVEHWLRNDYYPDDESFLGAIADVLHEEYTAITDAGLLLQRPGPAAVPACSDGPILADKAPVPGQQGAGGHEPRSSRCLGSSLARAASTARSAQSGLGRAT